MGGAQPEVQIQVIHRILTQSRPLSVDDQALLLAIARLESGFNPDAASKTSSAVGVFQIIRANWQGLNLPQESVFDADSNIRAGIQFYQENLRLQQRKFPGIAGDEKAVLLYALHHDGPSLNSGGAKIAREALLPYFNKFRALVLELNTKRDR